MKKKKPFRKKPLRRRRATRARAVDLVGAVMQFLESLGIVCTLTRAPKPQLDKTLN